MGRRTSGKCTSTWRYGNDTCGYPADVSWLQLCLHVIKKLRAVMQFYRNESTRFFAAVRSEGAMVCLGSISKAAKGIITSWYDSCEGAFFVAVAVQLTISIGGCDRVSGYGHARSQSLGRVEQFKSSVSLSASRRL